MTLNSEFKLNEVLMKIMTFEILCSNCNAFFALPLLSNFSYGEILIQLEDGSNSAHLSLLCNKSIDSIFNAAKEKAKSNDVLNVERWLISKISDTLIGGNLSSKMKTFCPQCKSSRIMLNDSKPLVMIDVEEIQFSHFESLTVHEQHKMLDSLIKEYYRSIETQKK